METGNKDALKELKYCKRHKRMGFLWLAPLLKIKPTSLGTEFQSLGIPEKGLPSITICLTSEGETTQKRTSYEDLN